MSLYETHKLNSPLTTERCFFLCLINASSPNSKGFLLVVVTKMHYSDLLLRELLPPWNHHPLSDEAVLPQGWFSPSE